jgi:glycosyltransferase involved in cell wall biosynthesis
MNIVIVNTGDAGGGAEGVSSILADGLRSQGHRVSFLCSQANRASSRSIMGTFDWLLGRSLKRIGYADAVSLAAIRFLSYPEVRDADVIHFHNLHGFYFGAALLPKIIAAKPCVWTLHDCWAVTGGCYGQMNCQNWLHHCKPCPGYGVFPMVGMLDTAPFMLKLKRRAFDAMVRHGGVMTGVSEWMANRIRQAFVVADLDPSGIQTITNYVDIPSDENDRASLPVSLPTDQPVVLLVAANVNNRTKGMSTALSALQNNLEHPFTLLTVGTPFPDSTLQQYGLDGRTQQLGRLDDRNRLAAAYGAATFTLVPSLAESFCLVAAESIACGTPVIASDINALPELVRDNETGFLAEVENVEDFSRKIKNFFEMSSEDYKLLCQTTKQFANKKFPSFISWVECYTAVYKRAIFEHRC